MSDLSEQINLRTRPLSDVVRVEPWRKVLLSGAQRIEDYGHWKKGSANGWFCAITSMREPGTHAYEKAYARLLAFTLTRHGRAVAEWNDAPETTAAEVIAAMRLVAQS